jgi:hypothetical protein
MNQRALQCGRGILWIWLSLLSISSFMRAESMRAIPSRLGPAHAAVSTGPKSGPKLSLPSENAIGITFGRIDYPRSPSGTAYGLNGKDDVVGVWGPISPIGYFGSFGYLLKGNTYHDFNYPGAVASGPIAINTNRQIVGYYDPDGDGNFHAYLYRGGKFTNIDYPGSLGGAAFGINDAGMIIGTYYDASTTAQHGFILSKGIYTTIDPPGSVSTEPLSLNSNGTVVGDYYDSAQNLHGFIYHNGQFATVDYPGSADTILSGINDAGQIVGGYGATITTGAYEWRTPNMFLLSQGQFTPLTLPVDNAQVTIPYAFKGDSVVGFYADSMANLYGYEIQLTGTMVTQSRTIR